MDEIEREAAEFEAEAIAEIKEEEAKVQAELEQKVIEA